MGFLAKIFGKKKQETKVGGMEDYMTLIRVYFQASLASNLGISNLGLLVGEKSFCKKMMKEIYKCDDDFFKEIDATLKKNCRKLQDVQPFMYVFQGFSQDLMMLMGNLMKFKIRMPSFFKKAIYAMTEKTVDDVFHKNDYKDAGVMKTVHAVRQYNQKLGFSQKWVTDFVYQVVMLAKKEPRKKDGDNDQNAKK